MHQHQVWLETAPENKGYQITRKPRRRIMPLILTLLAVGCIFLFGFLAGRWTAFAADNPPNANPAFTTQTTIPTPDQSSATTNTQATHADSVQTTPPAAQPAGGGITDLNQTGQLEEDDSTTARQGNVDTGSWSLLLVNQDHPLPQDFGVELAGIGNYQFDARAVDALREMLDAAQAEGLSPIICSAYRSLEKQTTLYENKVGYYLNQGHTQAEAERLAATVVAYPGTSEHNSGLAVDIVALAYQLLDEEQANTAETRWLHENCHRFGFILRYPAEKQAATGIIYEPWHYRYVGVEAATEIKESGLCLEEYLAQ